MGSREGNVTSFASLSLASRTDSLSIGTSYTTGVSGRNVELSSAYSGSGDHASILRDIHVLTSAGIMQLTDRYAGRLYMDATSASGLGGSSIASFLRVPPVVRAMIMLEDFSRRGQEYVNKLAEDKAKEVADGEGKSAAATGGPKGQLPDGEDPEGDDKEVKYPNNPKESPKSYRPLESSGAKKNLEDGSVWEKDTSSHGGEQWKRWDTQRAWEKGEKPNSIWPNGTVRK